jgi:hypothetical protein
MLLWFPHCRPRLVAKTKTLTVFLPKQEIGFKCGYKTSAAWLNFHAKNDIYISVAVGAD